LGDGFVLKNESATGKLNAPTIQLLPVWCGYSGWNKFHPYKMKRASGSGILYDRIAHKLLNVYEQIPVL